MEWLRPAGTGEGVPVSIAYRDRRRSRWPRARRAAGLFDELVIDSFAGAGGASLGIERAIGRSVDVAINHDSAALAMHAANGAFAIPLKSGAMCLAIASDGVGWDHVSVSLPHRCPTWEEMAEIKGLFWEEHECVVQFHPPKERYVNCHPHCLHLWRPQTQAIPHPPTWMVGTMAQER